jgi:hypothetical protein
MKILNAEEFAAKVMENGTEVEPDEYKTMNFEDGETVWTIYAHIDADGNLVHNHDDAEWTITADMNLTEEQSEALMQGELDDMEKDVIISDLYPQYVETLKENEEWINL